jgi:RNase P subunit RPR2
MKNLKNFFCKKCKNVSDCEVRDIELVSEDTYLVKVLCNVCDSEEQTLLTLNEYNEKIKELK